MDNFQRNSIADKFSLKDDLVVSVRVPTRRRQNATHESLSESQSSHPRMVLDFSPCELFYGREEVLSSIHENLRPSQLRPSGQRQYTLYGIGGVGKTQIAIHYISQYSSSYRYIFWTPAEEPQQLLKKYSQFATALFNSADTPFADDDRNADKVRERLNTIGVYLQFCLSMMFVESILT